MKQILWFTQKRNVKTTMADEGIAQWYIHPGFKSWVLHYLCPPPCATGRWFLGCQRSKRWWGSCPIQSSVDPLRLSQWGKTSQLIWVSYPNKSILHTSMHADMHKLTSAALHDIQKPKALLYVCSLAADWPDALQIVTLIHQGDMNDKFDS